MQFGLISVLHCVSRIHLRSKPKDKPSSTKQTRKTVDLDFFHRPSSL